MNDERDDHSPGRHSRQPQPDGRGTPPPPQRPGPPRPGDQARPPQRPGPPPGPGGPAWPSEEPRPGPRQGPPPPPPPQRPPNQQWPGGNPDAQETQQQPAVPAKWPEGESAQERTGAWTPSFDDDDDDGSLLSKRLSGDSDDSADSGRKVDLPTSYTPVPPPPGAGPRPNAGREGPPPRTACD
ncbi:hypothetical protein ABT324_03095, partial [Saccharopolyspora sp. NPDC000359]